MKKNLLVIIFLFIGTIYSIAGTKYVVITDSPITVYYQRGESRPDFDVHVHTKSNIMRELHKGDTIEKHPSYEEKKGWAPIIYKYQTGWVNAKYVESWAISPINTTPPTDKFTFYDFSEYIYYFENDEYLDIIIIYLFLPMLIFSMLLWIIRRIRKKRPLNKAWSIFNSILFVTTAIFEILYIALMGTETTWFCDPDLLGILVVVPFLLYGYLVYNQIMCFTDVVSDTQQYFGKFNIVLGMLSWFVFLILGSILLFAGTCKTAFLILFALFIICQLIQLVRIFKDAVPHSGWGAACWMTLIYLFGSIATIWFMVHFIKLVLVVVIICVIGLLLFILLSSLFKTRTVVIVSQDLMRYMMHSILGR